MTEQGMRQSREVIQALGAAVTFMRKAGENGYGFDDLRDALGDEQLIDALADGLTGIEQVPGEFTSAGLRDWISLGIEAMEEFKAVGA